jgi:signal transduction histidine kinase
MTREEAIERGGAVYERYALAEGVHLRERRRFETILTSLLIDFSEARLDVDALVRRWLGHVGECLGIDHVVVYRMDRRTGEYEASHSWHDASPSPLADRIRRPTEFGPHALAVPFEMEGVACYLTLAATAHGYQWPAGVEHDLSLIAEVFAQAVARRRAEGSIGDVSGRIIDAQEAERRRIGRELHDHIGPRLALLALLVEELRPSAAANGKGRETVSRLRQQIVEVSKELHDLSYTLHSATLEAQGLVPALRRLVTELSERHHLIIGFIQHAVPPALAPDIALCLYRIAEESLSNVVKHSRARTAVVEVTGGSNEIHLSVRDQGAGFDPAARRRRTGLGLVSMRARLRLVLGTMNIESAPAHGTKVSVRVPTVATVATLA